MAEIELADSDEDKMEESDPLGSQSDPAVQLESVAAAAQKEKIAKE